MVETLKVKVCGETIEVLRDTPISEISNKYQNKFSSPIILAKVNNAYQELAYTLKHDCELEFLTVENHQANRAYLHGLIYLTKYAASFVLPEYQLTVEHSIDKGLFIETDKPITKDKLNRLKEKMKEIIKLNLPIQRLNVNRLEAINYFEGLKDYSKVGILTYNTNTYITLYKLGDQYNFFFSLMPSNTRCLERFDLKYLNENGFVLLYQTVYMNNEIKNYSHHPMLFDVFKEYHEWAKLMKIDKVPSLNKVVSSGNIDNIIRIDETLQSNRLLNIAKDIYDKKNNVKIVLIAGPSSSGKTTTCNKLSMYLKSFGLNPKTLSMDNYFVEREKNPKDKDGNYDFECLEAIDLKKFDRDIEKILDSKKVQTPYFNFITGKPEPGEFVELGQDDILIIEGIHGLNTAILSNIPRKSKYKIYISPLTGLNLDDENRISTTDNRLLRRMVRDNKHRGYRANHTLKSWASVRYGEEKHIFPYQDEADAIFNSALIYEIGVLKVYAEPLLYSVDINDPYYEDAKRLINMLKMFLPIPADDIPKDSLLREFIGGGCFRQ